MEKNSVNTVNKTFSHSPGFSLSAAPDFHLFHRQQVLYSMERSLYLGSLGYSFKVRLDSGIG
jgi:hypothetical protein